jgi:hypothetical protein
MFLHFLRDKTWDKIRGCYNLIIKELLHSFFAQFQLLFRTFFSAKIWDFTQFFYMLLFVG